jgi:hypothetical protein
MCEALRGKRFFKGFNELLVSGQECPHYDEKERKNEHEL